MSSHERFMAKVEITDACWLWMGTRDRDGYGKFRASTREMVHAYRWAYEHFVGPIPLGMEMDHLCRVRECVRPEHLEPVTKAENMRRGNSPHATNARKATCPRGHAYSGRNAQGGRICRECQRAAERRYRARQAREVQ